MDKRPRNDKNYMDVKVVALILVAVVASGCAASNTNPDSQDPGTTPSSDLGQFQLYISDQPAAIDNFDHLNVTVSNVRVFKASEDNSSTNSTNSTEDSEEGFQEFEVTETVDLTQLRGENATSVLEEDLEVGNYSKMELEASAIDAEVDGSSVNVKLPSGKLQLTKGFTIAPNSTTEFVFDIQVVQRGNQGYILRPVISQSGTVGEDVEINRKGRNSAQEEGDEEGNSSSGPPENVPA